MALTESEETRASARFGFASLAARLRGWLNDHNHNALAQRVAGVAFLIRMGSAGLLYLSHVLFARWMGSFEFGIYVYVWTWVLLIGGLFELGLAAGAQRFIPEYAGRRQFDRLRGFLAGSQLLVAAFATAGAAIAALLVFVATPWLDNYMVLPLYLACLCLPFYAMNSMQEGIARSYNWFGIALAPPYLLRPLMLVGAMGTAYALGAPVNAQSAMLAAVAATWASTLLQLAMLHRCLTKTVPKGEATFEPRRWLAVSVPMFMVDGFYLLLSYTDVLMLKHLRGPQDIAIYYAAAKTMALVAFVSFAVSAAVAHRFAEYHVQGDRERLESFLAQSIRWTFWPSLAGLAVILMLGKPLLRLFGADFASGYPVMFVIAAGLLARAAVGPVDRLLNMLDQQKMCAAIYGVAFLVNLVGCILFIPRFGGVGAAAALASALVIESILLFVVARRRLCLHVFVFRAPQRSGATS